MFYLCMLQWELRDVVDTSEWTDSNPNKEIRGGMHWTLNHHIKFNIALYILWLAGNKKDTYMH